MKRRKFGWREVALFVIPAALLALPILLRRNPKSPVEIQLATPFSGNDFPRDIEIQRLSNALHQYPENKIFTVYWRNLRVIKYDRGANKLWSLFNGGENSCLRYIYQDVTDEKIHALARRSGTTDRLKSLGCLETKKMYSVSCENEKSVTD